MKYSYSKLSGLGGRTCNEDSLAIEETDDALIAVVADGLGGLGGGDIASQTAVLSVLNYFQKAENCSAPEVLSAIKLAGEAVTAMQTVEKEMKTTIVLLFIESGKAVCGHLGDSRLYQFRDDKIVFQTQDHSISQMAVSVGEITPEEIRSHADRNKLLRALGTKEQIPAQIQELTVQRGDGFLLCSDGFWELVLENEMIKDYIKSKNADDWLAKMRIRLERRLTDQSDNYSAITVWVE